MTPAPQLTPEITRLIDAYRDACHSATLGVSQPDYTEESRQARTALESAILALSGPPSGQSPGGAAPPEPGFQKARSAVGRIEATSPMCWHEAAEIRDVLCDAEAAHARLRPPGETAEQQGIWVQAAELLEGAASKETRSDQALAAALLRLWAKDFRKRALRTTEVEHGA